VREVLPATLVALLTVPVALLLGAYLWQLLPQRVSVRLGGLPRLALIALACLGVGISAAVVLGPLWERLFFAGDVEAWLDGRIGGAFGGWFYLLLPASGLFVAFLSGRVATPRLAARSKSWNRERLALADLGKFAGGLGIAVLVALVAASLLDVAGADPRGQVVGTYVQLNALIVGFVMGFAIIPIIYTLSESALSEVPAHLREASLGAGATPWQTAVRIVIPTGMSGLFSAMMVGLGRAVGETMIVLMAAGNTPILDWNPFNGFRTLSANIAYELPEAVRNSAHYRTLFLAALVLFGMTFVVNTVAEAVRRQFRKKAQAL
jgi:phosphate transport system permease protein